MRNFPQQLSGFFPHSRIKIAGEGPIQIGGNGTDVLGDGHLIVIENDDEILANAPCMVQPLQSHAGGHGSITNHADDFVLLTLLFPRLDHPVGGRNAGAGMPGIKGVVDAFLAFAKSAQSAILAKGVKLLPPPG